MNFCISRLNLVKRKRQPSRTTLKPLHLNTPPNQPDSKGLDSIRLARGWLPAVSSHSSAQRSLFAAPQKPQRLEKPHRLRHSRTAACVLEKRASAQPRQVAASRAKDEELDAWDHSLQGAVDFTLSKYRSLQGF